MLTKSHYTFLFFFPKVITIGSLFRRDTFDFYDTITLVIQGEVEEKI